MKFYVEFDNEDDAAHIWHLLLLLQKLKAVKFKDVSWEEYGTTWMLVVEYF